MTSNLPVLLFFIVGYVLIIFEFHVRLNKTAVALLTAVVCWGLDFVIDYAQVATHIKGLNHHLSDISQILFFLIGAMTLVELIDSHRGFAIFNRIVTTSSKRKLLTIVSIVSFFLSSVLDNLTTTILMISILRRLVPNASDRLYLNGMVVIAANAGGAWTPIGDVTTTMLWINNKVSTLEVITQVFIPSLIAMIIPYLCFFARMKGKFSISVDERSQQQEPGAYFVLIAGLIALIGVPVVKYLTGLPPYMGMLLALSLLWIITDLLHFRYEDRKHLRVPHVLTKIDISAVLFFLGILLAVDALEDAGYLKLASQWLATNVQNTDWIATFIGVVSSIVDNVPLVSAAMGMYDTTFPINHPFWLLLAFTAGTGGSILIIGSAAGVAMMGLEKVSFFSYVRHVTIPALLGFIGGTAFYFIFY